MNGPFTIGMLWSVSLLSGYGVPDAPSKNVFHPLGGMVNSAKNTFTEDSRGGPSPAPGHHRNSATRHLSSKKVPAKHSESSVRKTDGSDEASEAKSASESSRKEKNETSGTGDEKAGSNASTPANDEAAGADSEAKSGTAAPMATLKPEALREFAEQPPKVQELIRSSLALTERNLSYKYGSADPAAGGMDCSGFIYYVLTKGGYKDVPRDSSGQYAWVRKESDFHAVLSRSGDSFELHDLSPGDLLFWSGTYRVDKDIPITHVMIYLGKEKSTGNPVMVGATDGRSYNGVRRFGVSVFDFKMPSGQSNRSDPGLTAKFEGYASIPHLRETGGEASKNQMNQEKQKKSGKEPPDGNVKPHAASLGDGD